MTGGALFVFAHHDDEVAAATRISYERSLGKEIYCAFLTGGDERRLRESANVLARLGVDRERVAFIGTAEGIADQALLYSLDRALLALERWLETTSLEVVYSLAFEGGHHDHDASHLVAMALAGRRGMLDRCFELPLYRGIGSRGPFFRVFSPSGDGWQQRRIGFREGARVAALSFRYPSQWRSWIGLFPEAFVKLAILRREHARQVDLGRVTSALERGTPFYSRRYRFRREEFAAQVAPFIARHLAAR